MLGDSSTSEQIVLTTQTAVAATNTGVAGSIVHRAQSGIVLTLDVTSAAAAVGDTLDVFVQSLLGSGMWVDCVHFTQVLGNGGAKRFVAKLAAGQAETMFETGTALAAGAIRNLIGDQLRVRFVIAGAGPVFTFTVTAQPL